MSSFARPALVTMRPQPSLSKRLRLALEGSAFSRSAVASKLAQEAAIALERAETLQVDLDACQTRCRNMTARLADLEEQNERLRNENRRLNAMVPTSLAVA